MKKLLFILAVLILPLSSQASTILIEAVRNEQKAIQHYKVTTWSGENQKPVYTKYTIAEAQTKFASLLTKNQAGTSGTPDRIILNYNDAGDLISMEFQVAGGEFERTILKGEAIPLATKTDSTAAKTDVETKTGKDIGGGEIKPPKVDPLPEDPKPE
jgi:hypothetical protein